MIANTISVRGSCLHAVQTFYRAVQQTWCETIGDQDELHHLGRGNPVYPRARGRDFLERLTKVFAKRATLRLLSF